MAGARLAVPARRAKSASPPKRSTAPGAPRPAKQMSFNPWHALPDHRPLGDFNRARRDIYRAMAAFRHERRQRLPTDMSRFTRRHGETEVPRR